MKKTLLVLSLLTMSISNASLAANYRATNWMQPIHTLNSEPYQKFSQELKEQTKGEVDFTVYSAGTLVPAKSTAQALRDGTADLGIVYPGYTPAEMPLGNVLVDLGFLVKDPMAAAFAYTEINLMNKKMHDEWQKQGILFVGGYSTPIYNFMCVKPIKSLDDVKGKKIRTAGGTQTDWVSSIGGVAVSVPIGDVYTGLTRGSVDCTMAEVPNLINSKFIEVVKSMTLLDMGAVPGATYVLNPKFWASLSSENKKIMLSLMAQGLAKQQVAYNARTDEAKELAKGKIDLIEPDQTLTDKLLAFQEQYIKDLPQKSIESRKIDDPSELIQEYLTLEKKWTNLLDGVDRTNTEQISQLLEKEIYSKLDLETLTAK